MNGSVSDRFFPVCVLTFFLVIASVCRLLGTGRFFSERGTESASWHFPSPGGKPSSVGSVPKTERGSIKKEPRPGLFFHLDSVVSNLVCNRRTTIAYCAMPFLSILGYRPRNLFFSFFGIALPDYWRFSPVSISSRLLSYLPFPSSY